ALAGVRGPDVSAADRDPARRVADRYDADRLVVLRIDHGKGIRSSEDRLRVVARRDQDSDDNGRRGKQKDGGEQQPTASRLWSWRSARAAGCKLGILLEYLPLELLELGAGLEPELLVQDAARASVGVERVGLPARCVQRTHELRVRAFSQRVLGDHP